MLRAQFRRLSSAQTERRPRVPVRDGAGTTTPEEIIHTISDDRTNPLEEPGDSSADPALGGEDLIAPPPADSDADLAAEAQPAGEALVSTATRDGAGDGSSSQYVLLIAATAVAGLGLGTLVWRARRSRS